MGKEEFRLLYEMAFENEWDLYKILEHANKVV